MPETKVEPSRIFPTSKTELGEISEPQDPNLVKIEEPPAKPAPGRLPARASRF
jgi:hypothetical protein